MAKVSYKIRSKENKVQPIYIYFSAARGVTPSCKTGLVIQTDNWSTVKKLPKNNDSQNKQITQDLKRLDSHIIECYNTANSNGATINTEWLKKAVDSHFNRSTKEEQDRTTLVNYYQHMIDLAPTRTHQNKTGLSDSRIKGYKTAKTVIENFQKYKNTTYTLNDVDVAFSNDFNYWLLQVKKYSANYSGKQIDELLAICNFAEKNGEKVNPLFKHIDRYKEKEENRFIVTLSLEELKKIKEKEIIQPYLINTRKWLLIGCEIGQRGGDLLELTKDNFRKEGDLLFVDVTQQKTKKEVTAVIINEDVKNIVLNDMPHHISDTKFNKYVKILCKECEINNVVEGNKMNPITKRKERGMYPKHEIISSHSCRRSFATNYYKKIPTAVLIEITGHSKESEFLSYINKKRDKDDNARLFVEYFKSAFKKLN